MRQKNIICKLAGILGPFLMSGCATLLNSDRPRYSGPVRAATWHNASVKVETTPVIHDGVVYAIASSMDGALSSRLFAFDLKSGRKLWESTASATEILCLALGAVYTGDNGKTSIGVVDAGSGAQIAPRLEVRFSKATEKDGVLYLAGNGVVEARSLAGPGQSSQLWRATMPLTSPREPVAAGGTVYVYGITPANILLEKKGTVGMYAFDAKSGSLRWKWEHTGKVADTVAIQSVTADESAAFLWTKDTSGTVFGNGVLTAFSATTGKHKWTYSTSMYAPLAGQPLLFDPQAVVVADYPTGKDATSDSTGFVYRALDRDTGAKLWESRTNWKYRTAATLGGLLLASEAKVHEVFNENLNKSLDSWVSAVDLRSGKERWRSTTVELGIFTAPVAGEGMVVVGSAPSTSTDPPRKGKDDVAGLWAWEASR